MEPASPTTSNTENTRPMTAKDRAIGLAVGIGLIALGVVMWLYPDPIPLDANDLSRARTRFWVTILDMAWSRPVGAVSGLVGLLVVYGSATRKTISDD